MTPPTPEQIEKLAMELKELFDQNEVKTLTIDFQDWRRVARHILERENHLQERVEHFKNLSKAVPYK